MFGPEVTIDLARIERNARTVVDACRAAGIGVFGVTKGSCGMPQVARAMLRGGVIGIGESRFENIRRLRASGIDAPVMLLRSPPLSRIEEVVGTVDISLNSELAVVEELSRVAERMGRIHDIMLMVDLGDLREGIWPRDLVPTVEKVVRLPGVRIAGIGTNLTCFGAILPSKENLDELVGHARQIEATFGLELTYVSGGNSSSLPLLLAGKMPSGVNNLRVGEAILQGGRDTFLDEPWQDLERDGFLLSGELLEVKLKPSMPIGQVGLDAFGHRPVFEDRGVRMRGIVNIGREDVAVEGLEPTRPGVAVLGASSDHLVVDLSEAEPPPRVGDRLSFRMSYGALLAAMTSEYVEKTPMFDQPPGTASRRLGLFVEPELMEIVNDFDLLARLAALGFATETMELPLGPADGGEAPAVAKLGAALKAGAVPLLLGADHLTTLTGLRALAAQTDAIGLIWFDARASFMPPGEGAAPHPADSVLYRALGHDPGFASLLPQLSPETVAIIGLREAEPSEAEIIKASGVAVHTMVDVDAVGIREVMRRVLKTATAGTRGFYVSYCPAVTDVPGTRFGSGGMTVRETHQAMESIARAGGALAIDVVGLTPDIEPRNAAEAFHFVLSCLGKQIL
jgi:predicted amino acid racemase/arginase family enzyme